MRTYRRARKRVATTAADRNRVRLELDLLARARIAADAPGCANCGCHLDNQTRGCKRCWERHRQRLRWKDPAYKAKWNGKRKSRAKKSRQPSM